MVEDTELRVHSIMENLFPSSKSTTSFFSYRAQRPGEKGQADGLAVVESRSCRRSLHVPVCRPWDRIDLWRRLATFKSITWFAKPKVANAVNCARRGWINVDMDTVACEVCEARLLFPTPLSWSPENVEKAGLVFSLKLSSGHKRLCPWMDNACEETLSLFPPTQPADLVEGYKRRSFALLQLTALPVIAPTAIDFMKNHHSGHLLTGFLESYDCNEQATRSAAVHLHMEDGATAPNLYHQAHKLISLCGWELRSLPYVVDSDLSSSKQSPSVRVYSSHTCEAAGANDGSSTGACDFDPNSAVLDCKVCGASVAVWAYSSVPRPLELLRLVGCAGLSGNNDSGNVVDGVRAYSNEKSLNMTIAGGPPPAKHNFKALISMPVVGQNLIARLYSANCKGQSGSELCDKADKSRFSICTNGSEHQGEFHDSSEESSQPRKLRRIELQGVEKENWTPLEGENMFNPIIQHRTFCPWIVGTDDVLSGWRQTLSALMQTNEFSEVSTSHFGSCSVIKEEDPVGSIRKLFTTQKRVTHPTASS